MLRTHPVPTPDFIFTFHHTTMDEHIPESSAESTSQPSPEPCVKCEEYLAGWKRAQADYQNLQRERERERQDLAKYANERLLRELLPAFDQYQLAVKYIPSTDSLPDEVKRLWEQWLVGVKAVEGLWNQAAQQAGLERIATDGIFDPQFHEAVAEEVSDQLEGAILKVLTPGWKLHGRVLQAARVIIAKSA